MKLIKPFYEIVTPINGEEILKQIELAARTCYKSENKIEYTQHRLLDGNIEYEATSAKILIKKLLARGHDAMLEFGGMINVKFTCDRGVSHELVRHRLCSFAQECVSGDTEIYKGITIKNLYDRKNKSQGKIQDKTILLKSVNENKEIVPNKINEIFYKGKQEVYEVKTQMGYKIKCTLNHEFLTDDNFKKLNDLNIGDFIYVNGRPSLIKNSNKNIINNLLKLCIAQCHKLFHKKWYKEKIITKDKIVSINYIGIEDTYDLEMNDPYHNYIANGFVVHNSTRYCNYSKNDDITFIIPCWMNIPECVYKNKDDIDLITDVHIKTWMRAMFDSEQNYKDLIKLGWSPQQARSILPNSIKTEINMSANIREWRKILQLRISGAAHPQMKELMRPLLDEFKRRIPIIFDDINY